MNQMMNFNKAAFPPSKMAELINLHLSTDQFLFLHSELFQRKTMELSVSCMQQQRAAQERQAHPVGHQHH